MTYSINDQWAKSGPRILGCLLGLTPLIFSLLATGCSTSVSASGNTTTGSCSANPNSTMPCTQGAVYTCTGNSVPGYACSTDGAGNYCCDTGVVTTGSCTLNAGSCSNSTATSSGYSCTGTAQPEQQNPNLICNTNGAGDYCCDTGSATTCQYDPYVNGCVSGTSGYSCQSGEPAPDVIDSMLVCSVPTTVSGLDEYCCYTNTVTNSGTCKQDSSVSPCAPDSAGNPSYGFSCTGTDTPDMDFSSITCSSGTQGTDVSGDVATLYCCTYQ